ncbi:MAG: AbrB/MazE/SpoVT family DNA-binding domain-containing protein [Gammaproteobacteria bacterium]|nr:AbrB/MazE/SpoVT family DNA-binding domain-containing protein [Gammaproteobacteria bacterium]MBU2059837.1 AbrB/MazE/SpoVT family DNA-binding domain-containing protein [Gammaproteobacteria bacterium]MBU2175382.1 AbrB/MazE/SpoVT family DNA-binding domain-containing protein [Gammaproteobacteria bacterium]MBU2245710.1 AbrB/MazE/SpoVT family DNA-binding domain-containing protein [Gammaproteobacteria bacterium]MBU2345114.1 AbrB/MazE/SpoVT family DNA-binding domain-containing protein [Gammaproteobac
MKTGTVFQHKNSQAISLPAEAHFPERVKEVSIRVVGQDRIITPVTNIWDSFFLQSEAITEDFALERANQEQQERERF